MTEASPTRCGKATADAHPIQGLIKYHGLRDAERNIPYHDSISVCTGPSTTRTTVEFGYDRDTCLVNRAELDELGYERLSTVLDRVRERAGIDSGARIESINTFPSNVGLGASASAYAALATAATTAAGLDLSTRELSALARCGATSAARSVPGGFAHLRTAGPPEACVGERIADTFSEELRIVVGNVPQYKRTARAHAETPQSPLFDARLASIHGALDEMYRAIRAGDFDATFRLAEHDSLHLLAVTMTGPDGWVYWQPETLQMLQTARRLRTDGIPVYFSADTGATAYLNTTAEYADEVAAAVESDGIETDVWHVAGGPTRHDDHLF